MAEDGVIDLASRQRQRLEKDCARLKASNEALIELAKTNLVAQAQTHSAVLAVLEADSLLALDKKLAGKVAATLGVDVVRVYIEGQAPLPAGEAIRACAPDLVGALLGGRPERIGPIDTRFSDALYAPQSARLRSEALVGLDLGPCVGVLCLGSRDGAMFTPSQAGDLLHFLARVIERRLVPWLNA